MDERVYEGLVTRYAPSWNAPPQAACGGMAMPALPPSMPTGKPTNAEFPTAASTPPVNIMTPEPPLGAAPQAAAGRAAAPAPASASGRAPAQPRAGCSQEAAAGAETAPRRCSSRRPLAAPTSSLATSDLFKARAGR